MACEAWGKVNNMTFISKCKSFISFILKISIKSNLVYTMLVDSLKNAFKLIQGW